MEGKKRVCGLKHYTGVSNAPRPTAEKRGEQEEAVVVVVTAAAEMVCFGLHYVSSSRLKVRMNGYVSGYAKAFNFCLSGELTATAPAPATVETEFDNNIVECVFEFSTGVPIATDCFEDLGSEFGTDVPLITGIIYCFVKKEKGIM